MKNEELKNSLDDALSGIEEDPWLLTRVVSRAESMEDTPVKKKFVFGTVQVILTIVLLMSVGIASLSSWNRTESQPENEPIPLAAPVFSGMEAETERARLKIDSAVYDGSSLAVSWTLENKNPEVPMWSWMETLSVNGIEYDLRDINPEEQWTPGESSENGTARHEWFSDLPDELVGTETIHVEMRINTSRPVRPWKMVETARRFREELEQLIAEGYYVIPAFSWEEGSQLFPEGYFQPEEDLTICENGWCITVSGGPLPDDTMGDIIVETLNVSFDVVWPEYGRDPVSLNTRDIYDNEYCTAVFERAELTPLGLYLTIRVNPKTEDCFPPRSWELSKGTDLHFGWSSFSSPEMKNHPSPDHEGETVWEFMWRKIKPEDLPDAISLNFRLQNYELVRFPIEVRQPE